jgi:phospho-N-acetylmuramoyl-pentapeptide-transferase
MAFFIVGTINSVQITDGVDGLLSGVTIPVAVLFIVAAFAWARCLRVFLPQPCLRDCWPILFITFNPAKVFMGDTALYL